MCLQILQVDLVTTAFAILLLLLSLCGLLSKEKLIFIVIECNVNEGGHYRQVSDSLGRNRTAFYVRDLTEPVHLDSL